MIADISIQNGQVYRNGQFEDVSVTIQGERIEDIGTPPEKAKRVIDAKGMLLLPGIIDGHVHLREPGGAQKEDFTSGTEAAARGGVTTVVDMPNNTPPIKTPERLKRKAEIAKEKSLTNFALYAGIPERIELVPELAETGAIGFKYYMADEEVSERDLAREIEKVNSLLTVHAEDKSFFGPPPTTPTNPAEYLQYRPPEAELEALKSLKDLPCSNLHIAHVSLSQSVHMAGEEGWTTEVTPHHLLLAAEDVSQPDYTGITKPPIRRREEVNKLQRDFERGLIDIVASDHAPHKAEEKLTCDPCLGCAGISGIETTVPLLLSYAREEKIPLGKVIDRMTKRPANLFGFPNRGEIEEGNWADLTLVDPGTAQRVTGEGFFSKAKITPFEGFKLRYWPVVTIVNGVIVFDRGEISSSPAGRFLGGNK